MQVVLLNHELENISLSESFFYVGAFYDAAMNDFCSDEIAKEKSRKLNNYGIYLFGFCVGRWKFLRFLLRE